MTENQYDKEMILLDEEYEKGYLTYDQYRRAVKELNEEMDGK